MTDTATYLDTLPDNMLTVSDIVRQYVCTHAQIHRWIKNGTIPASAIQRQKYKGRQGWRSVIAVDCPVVAGLTRRDVPLTTFRKPKVITPEPVTA